MNIINNIKRYFTTDKKKTQKIEGPIEKPNFIETICNDLESMKMNYYFRATAFSKKKIDVIDLYVSGKRVSRRSPKYNKIGFGPYIVTVSDIEKWKKTYKKWKKTYKLQSSSHTEKSIWEPMITAVLTGSDDIYDFTLDNPFSIDEYNLIKVHSLRITKLIKGGYVIISVGVTLRCSSIGDRITNGYTAITGEDILELVGLEQSWGLESTLDNSDLVVFRLTDHRLTCNARDTHYLLMSADEIRASNGNHGGLSNVQLLNGDKLLHRVTETIIEMNLNKSGE